MRFRDLSLGSDLVGEERSLYVFVLTGTVLGEEKELYTRHVDQNAEWFKESGNEQHQPRETRIVYDIGSCQQHAAIYTA